MDALRIPVVTSSRRWGNRSSSAAGNGVRSRIAAITVNGSSAAAAASRLPSGSLNTVTSARLVTGPQSALLSATCW